MESNINSLVSVIIPCYNDYKYIHEAINSINNQTHKNIEIIIVDDGSDVKTKETLNVLKQDNLTILYQENAGPSVARNSGIKQAKGDYILTLDADDYFEPTFVSKAMEVLVERRNVGLVSCWLKIFKNGIIIGETHLKGGNADSLIYNNGAIGNALFRKQCWLDVNGYDELMRRGFEDWDFNISIAKVGWELFIIEEELFNYREKVKSRNKIATRSFKKELLKYIMTKHKDLYIKNYDRTIESLLDEIENLKLRSNNIKQSKDYIIGRLILFPFRKIKKILNFKQIL